MNILSWLFVVPLIVIVAVGGYWAAHLPVTAVTSLSGEPGLRRWRLTPRLQPGFGRISGCVLVLAAGTGVIIAICWPIGYAARKFDPQDRKVYHWVQSRANLHWLHSAMRLLTEMSNNRQSQVVAGAAMVLLTVAWFQRRGLAVLTPAVLVMTAYELEHQLQHVLKLLAARPGPFPPGLGNFPSGGVARLMSIYGLILYLALRRFNKLGSRAAALGWTLLAAATFTEAYSRLYLGKHWLSDIVGGLVFGAILLAVLIAATQMLDRLKIEADFAEPAVNESSREGMRRPAPRPADPGRLTIALRRGQFTRPQSADSGSWRGIAEDTAG